jgi:hypothetical protein
MGFVNRGGEPAKMLSIFGGRDVRNGLEALDTTLSPRAVPDVLVSPRLGSGGMHLHLGFQ